MIEYALSLNSQQRAPDISRLPLNAYKQEQSASLNAQHQAPDDPLHAQDSQYDSHDLFAPSPFFSQVLPRLPTKRHIHPLLLQMLSQGNAHLPPQLHLENTSSGILALRLGFTVRRLPGFDLLDGI